MLAKFKKNHVKWLAGAHGYLSFLASKAKAYIEGSPATQPHSRVSFDARPRVNSSTDRPGLTFCVTDEPLIPATKFKQGSESESAALQLLYTLMTEQVHEACE